MMKLHCDNIEIATGIGPDIVNITPQLGAIVAKPEC